MTKLRFQITPAVYLFLEQDDTILLLQRQNTGWQDGNYSVVAGHLNGGETLRQAMVREAREEVGIEIEESDLALVHVVHHQAEVERINFFLTARTWQGVVGNCEPEKCGGLIWKVFTDLPVNMDPVVRQAIGEYKKGRIYSEFGWRV